MRYNLAMFEARRTIVDPDRFAMAGGRSRAGRRIGIAAAVLLALAGFADRDAAATEPDLYTVSDIDVDVTAESAVAARDQAILLAQRRAYDKLLLQVADADAAAALPQLSNEQIADLVEDFDVVSERSSTVRYIGKYNFHFRADAVRRLLEENGVRYAVLTSPPVLVLPVLTAEGQSMLWSDANGWFVAWQNHPTAGSLVPVKLPLGDLSDMGTIDAAYALAGNITKLTPLALHYGAQSALVLEATLTADPASGARKLALAAQRYDFHGLVESFTDEVEGTGDDLEQLYDQAIDRVMQRIQTAWKQQNLVSSSVGQTIDVAVPIADYAAWLLIRRRLAQINTIQRVEMRSLRLDLARLEITYVGDFAQLEQALGTRSLTLTDDGGDMVLLPAGASTATP
jgi:Uncharacterized protein conserved in bacteria (DUF2066)